MGIDIGGNTLTQASGALTVDTGSATMQMLSTGGVKRPKQCQFLAYGTAAAWTNLANGWNPIVFPTASLNVNSCYNTGNGRFTVPVTGMYLFQASCYLLKDGASDSYYWHPMFGVNGAVAGRQPSGSPGYRIRGHGFAIAGYENSNVAEIYELIAGDYVEHYVFSNGSPLNRWYPQHSRYSGFLLG